MIGPLPRALAVACLAAGTAAPPVSGQSHSWTGWWKMSAGVAGGTITATHELGETGQSLPVVRLELERTVAERFSLGVAWSGAWYEDRWGSHRRHAVVLTASAYPWHGLRVSAGVGGGLTTHLEVDRPPESLPGEVAVFGLEEKGALALTADLGYDVSLGSFDLEPSVGVLAHRLRGETLSLATIGVRLGLRSRDHD